MDTLQRFNTIPLRLMVAFGMLYHGVPKFTTLGHEMFRGMLQSFGAPLPELLAWVVPVIEVGGALAIFFGAFTRLATVGLLAVQLVALYAVHLPNGFNAIHITGTTPQGPVFGMPGFELNLLYAAMLLALLIGGPGAVSVAARRHQPQWVKVDQYSTKPAMRAAMSST